MVRDRGLFGEATAWSLFHIGVPIAFGTWFTAACGGGYGTGYFAGYIVEKSLPVDNLSEHAGGPPARGGRPGG